MSLDPIKMVQQWFEEAIHAEPSTPEAMSVATVDSKTGLPSLRLVLLRGVDESGFVFYTNTKSRKGREIEKNSHVALALHWKSLGRQLRVEGVASKVSEAEADKYFASRHRGSQIGAWASDQSATLENRQILLNSIQQVEEKFKDKEVQSPPFWSGYRVKPQTIEFWEDRADRLHVRNFYWLDGDLWSKKLLHP